MMKTVKILATTDMHGHLAPFSYIRENEIADGLSHLGPIIEKNRDENTILVDAGDNLQGSMLMNYHMNSASDEITPVAQAMNFYRYDYYNIGNHDLNYGQKQLRKFLNEMNASCITGNFIFDQKPLSSKYRIHEFKNGVRIALIGALTDYVHHWEKPAYLVGYEIQDVFEFVQSAVKEIKEKEQVDAVVLIYHGGLERDWLSGEETEEQTGENVGYKICTEIDGIDLLISGHQHRSFVCRIKNTVVTQTAANGKEIAEIEIDPQNKNITAKILCGGDEYDSKLAELIQEEDKKTRQWLKKPLGCFKEGDCLIQDQFEARLHKHPLVSLLNEIQLRKSHAQLSAQCIYNDVEGLPHEITMLDLISTYVYPDTITVKEISGKILKEFLEKCAEYFDYQDDKICINKRFYDPKPMHFNYDMVDGIDYTVHASYPIGQRVTDILYQGKPVKDEDLFTFALSNYRAVGGGDFNMLHTCRTVLEIPDDVVDIIKDYILEKKVVEINHRENIKVIK